MVDEESGHIMRRNNVSTEKSIQKLKGQMGISPLAERQRHCSKSTPRLTCVVGLSAISAIANICVRDYLTEIPYV
jgi:hypothetical protein